MLSGGNTPLESEPRILQILMQGIATTHFVSFAQAILFRGAGLPLVFWDYLTVAVLGVMFFVLSVRRFRRASALATG
jgi:ABC-2 type transport system permease protein